MLFVDAGEGVLVRRMPKLSEMKGILKGSKIDFTHFREEERKLDAAREQRLMAIIERARKQQRE